MKPYGSKSFKILPFLQIAFKLFQTFADFLLNSLPKYSFESFKFQTDFLALLDFVSRATVMA